MEETNLFFFETGIKYLAQLDWRYIITLILFVEIIGITVNNDARFWKVFKPQYRVIVVGFLLALFFYLMDDKPERHEVLIMFQSMIAAIAIHTWVLKYIIRWIKSKAPKEIN